MSVGVIIGRFSGLHNAHFELIRRAVQENEKVLVLVGSAFNKATPKNPFTFKQRKELIELNLNASDLQYADINICPLWDFPHDDRIWKQGIMQEVGSHLYDWETEINLYGCDKDSSTYYVNLFPEWNLCLSEETSGISGTRVREFWFEERLDNLRGKVSDVTMQWLKDNPPSVELIEDYDYTKFEKRIFQSYPFQETLNFCCSDAIVLSNRGVLVIKRKHSPGKGKWALPGGFKNNNETFAQTAVRELIEETNINVPYYDLFDRIMDSCIFDDPSRSIGKPRITVAHFIDLTNIPYEITVSANDDASDADWLSLDKINCSLFDSDFHDDHLKIIRTFI